MIPLDRGILDDILAHPDRDDLRLVSADWWEDQGEAERAEFVRVQVALARMEARHKHECTSTVKRGMESAELRRRERELLGEVPLPVRGTPLEALFFGCRGDTRRPFEFACRRGFVHAATCTAADWLAHGDAIRAQQPVQAVTLTTWPRMDRSPHAAFFGNDHRFRLWLGEFEALEMNAPPQTSTEEAARALLASKWDGIDFTLPPYAGGFPVPPMFDNALLLNTLANGDAIPSTLEPSFVVKPPV